MSKSKNAFTMIELMVVVLVLAILAAASMAGYRGYRERVDELTCITNGQVRVAAIKLYAYDNNALPGSLSQLRPQDIERATALVIGGKQRYTMLAHLKELFRESVAEAVPLPVRYYQNNPSVIRCPSDSNGGVSYQINSAFANQPLSTLLRASGNAILVFDSDVAGDNGADPDNDVAFRHQGGNLAVRTTIGGEHRPKKRPGPGIPAPLGKKQAG
ncbi:MAG: prepilin-type N-terminal cleavage/methylation domain-containing protein [Candidatus Omnitrophica bacterium]|nr:prepilin-type N-terminal cleavage/methylation domain-containing protein [Candidatus Omnitrophota bacterium]